MRVLVFTALYPNALQHRHGVFIENRTRQYVANTGNQATVVAPVPWFPFSHSCFGQYAVYNKIPTEENRYGIQVYHPRYVNIPKIGMNMQPKLMFEAAKRFIKQLISNGLQFDVIDGHYFYPDGVVAAWLGQYFNKPVVISARGQDISFIPQYEKPRKLIQQAAKQASHLIAVCDALKQQMLSLAIDTPIDVLLNGVDLQLFQLLENRQQLRQQLGLRQFTLLSVGNMIELKGHHLVIEALSQLPGVELVLIGDGPEKTKYQKLAESLGVSERIKFLGNLQQRQLVDYYNAADVLTLISRREGCPNVLLESMACGNPVIANNVGGVSELVTSSVAGTLLTERSVAAIVKAVKDQQLSPASRESVRAYAEQYSWPQVSAAQQAIFEQVVNAFDHSQAHSV
ncbi:glycosyltransferase family 4 protein [Endozoicomonas sp. SM1973]|uniref:Glycosyltransferase family 4 protein n=1 Tax=Spartinivicinus marinus TaxID=2994442 RepID=A0A853IC72_9GAMM|nr:glycosyltransferase family 4 protein [Spartinivicinus marinus]MCX4024982.1 glycosyltransferase family 4 protein [Spartinivicinus marinus]NYZ67674.1 glycosyltransferase family 4 protein [Spartinivicinus marinus]